jgi:hypothetical protein
VQAKDRTIITATFRRRLAGELHDDTSGDQMDLMKGKSGPNNDPSGRAHFSFDIERGR